MPLLAWVTGEQADWLAMAFFMVFESHVLKRRRYHDCVGDARHGIEKPPAKRLSLSIVEFVFFPKESLKVIFFYTQ